MGIIPPVQNDADQRQQRQRSPLRKKRKEKERRQKRLDRRQAVRDGVIVTLSLTTDRRVTPDRRKLHGETR
ncbi:MAG: hypothetical protein KJP07_00235 [Desulfatitalea sp.]|nr:hypothetical protein [Desulfatitalea sp.]